MSQQAFGVMVWTSLFKGVLMAFQIVSPYLLFLLALLGVKIAFRRYRRGRLLESQRGIESLRALSWRDFEQLVGEAYRRQGYAVVERGGSGGDGGVDLELRRGAEKTIVQCKQWRTWTVGAPVVRELLGAMAAEGAAAGIVVTSGRFTRDAIRFAQGKRIALVDGPQLLELVRSVQTPSASSPGYAASTGLAAATPPSGAGTTKHPLTPHSPAQPQAAAGPSAAVAAPPHCPNCGATMVRRTARKGANAGQEFWGCPGYPRCRGTRPA